MKADSAQSIIYAPRINVSQRKNIVSFQKGSSITVVNNKKGAKVTFRINDIDTSGNSSVFTEASDYEVVIEPLNQNGHMVIVSMDDVKLANGSYKFPFTAKDGSKQEWKVICG